MSEASKPRVMLESAVTVAVLLALFLYGGAYYANVRRTEIYPHIKYKYKRTFIAQYTDDGWVREEKDRPWLKPVFAPAHFIDRHLLRRSLWNPPPE